MTKGHFFISIPLVKDFYHDYNSSICISLVITIHNLIKNYEESFGEPPKQSYMASV